MNRISTTEHLLSFAKSNNIKTRKSKNGVFFYYGKKIHKGKYLTKTITRDKVKDTDNVIQKDGEYAKIKYKKLESEEEIYFSNEETDEESLEMIMETLLRWQKNKPVLMI